MRVIVRVVALTALGALVIMGVGCGRGGSGASGEAESALVIPPPPASDPVMDTGAFTDDVKKLRTAIEGAGAGLRLMLVSTNPIDYAVTLADPLRPEAAVTLGNGLNPVVSPDGRKVAFVREREDGSGAFDLVLAQASGGEATVVAPDVQPHHGVVWSPDSSRVAAAVGEGDVLISDLAGTPAKVKPTGRPLESLAWSPDGTRIAFCAFGLRGPQIATMGADGSNVTMATKAGNRDRRPVWSPDGEWIAFERDRASIVRVRPDGTDEAVIARSQGSIQSIAWSPDGQRIAFVEQPIDDPNAEVTMEPGQRVAWAGYFALSIVDVSSGEVLVCARLDGMGGAVRWAPGGARLVLSQTDSRGRSIIQILDARDASVLAQIVDEGGGSGAPVWAAAQAGAGG